MEHLQQLREKLPARIGHLIDKFMDDTITMQEHEELDAWVLENDDNMKAFEDLTDEKNLPGLQKKPTGKKRTLSMLVPLMVAASVLLIIGFFIYHFAFPGDKKNLSFSDQAKNSLNLPALRLPGGKSIVLDSLTTGNIATGIEKINNNELVYQQTSKVVEPGLHTLVIPYGNDFKVTLPDGTRVWLNAGTKLSYPGTFSGNLREVELNGEAYFDIAKDSTRPFRVKLSAATMVVATGTHFNINNYDNEPFTAITLTEGKVSVITSSDTRELLPGEQLQIGKENTTAIEGIDTLGVASWTKGYFSFQDQDIGAFMRKLERWYNIKVIFKTTSNDVFKGTFNRDKKLGKTLDALQTIFKLNLRQSNDTVFVLP